MLATVSHLFALDQLFSQQLQVLWLSKKVPDPLYRTSYKQHYSRISAATGKSVLLLLFTRFTILLLLSTLLIFVIYW